MKQILEVITLCSSAEIFISDQMSYMQAKGPYIFHLICSPDERLGQYAKEQGVFCQSVEIERTPSLFKDLRAFFQIRRYIQKHKIDILIAHSFPKASLLSILAARTSSVRPYIIEIAHGAVYETLSTIKKWIIIRGERFVSSLADLVICVSPSVQKSREDNRINKKEKLAILSKGTVNGVDALHKFNPTAISEQEKYNLKQLLKIDNNDFILGFCGRLVRDKGIVELIEAYQILREEYPERSIKLLIIGSPEIRDALPERTINLLKNTEGIVFTGRVPYDVIQKYYTLMDVFVLPSYREGFPTVVLEASSMGVPVVTTRKTGCIDSIVDGETGLYSDLSPSALAETVAKLFNPSFAEKLGQNGRKWVLDYFEHTIVREAMFDIVKRSDI